MDHIATTPSSADRATARLERPPFDSVLGLARYLTVCGLAGLIAGIAVGGVGGRLFMRLAGAAAGARARGATTEAGFTVGEITLGGTLGLVVFVGIFAGLVGAGLYVVFRPWLSWAGPWRGVVFGIVLFASGSATSDVMNPDNVDFAILGNEVVVIVMILALFLGFGALIEPLSVWLDQRLPEGGRTHAVASGLYVLIAVSGLALGTLLLGFAMFTRSACTCDPPVVASLFVIITAIATLGWIGSAFSSSLRLRSISRVLGLVGVAGVIAAGLVRAIADATEILRG